MEKNTNVITEAFELVAATRQRKILRSVFNPLASAEVEKLKNLLTQALETEDARNDASFKESLLAALKAIEKHHATPATVAKLINKLDDVFATAVPNDEKPRILSDMQRKLHKSLKRHLGK